MTNFCNFLKVTIINFAGVISVSEIECALKILFYSIAGHYLFKLFKLSRDAPNSMYSVFYGFFSLAAILQNSSSFLVIVIVNILVGTIIDTLLGAIDRRLCANIFPGWFGLLGIFNCWVLEGFFDWMIKNSSEKSAIFLLVTGFSFVLIDLSLTLRRTA